MVSPEQIRMARAGLNWSATELSQRAGLALATVARFENGGGVTVATLEKMEKALEKAGIVFIPKDSQGGVGVRLKK